MVQENCVDFLNETGCCLSCDERTSGCLCYECKCTQCYWYTPPSYYRDDKGHCDYKKIKGEEKSKDWLENYSKKAKEKRLQENHGQTEIKDFNGGSHGNGTNL